MRTGVPTSFTSRYRLLMSRTSTSQSTPSASATPDTRSTSQYDARTWSAWHQASQSASDDATPSHASATAGQKSVQSCTPRVYSRPCELHDE